MRHRRLKRLNLNRGRRIGLLRSQLKALFSYGRIETSTARGRQVQRLAEKMITLAKKDTVANRRRIMTLLQDESLTKKLVAEIAPRYQERAGGYTRLLKLPPREGDGCPLSLLSLLS